MKADTFTNSTLFKLTTFLFAAALIITFMIVGQHFLIPLAWGLLIALSSIRMLDKIEYKLNVKRIVVTLIFVVLVLLLAIGFIYFIYAELRNIILALPNLTQRISEILNDLSVTLKSYGIGMPDHIDQEFIRTYLKEHSSAVGDVLSNFSRRVGSAFLAGIYLFFLIYYRDNYLYYLNQRYKNREMVRIERQRWDEVLDVLTSFLSGMLIVTVIMIVMLYIIFLLIGVQFALFWAVLVGVFTLVPYVGNPAGMLIVLIFTAITHEGWLVPLLAMGGIFFTNFLQENLFKPLIIGDRLKLNAFLIFLAVIFGGTIWGISGMILFMPIVGIIKLILEKNEATKPLSVLFTHIPGNVRYHLLETVKEDIEREVKEEEKEK